MKKPWMYLSVVMLTIGLIISACSKEANSGPNYIFKAAPSAGLAAKIKEKNVTEGELYKGIEGDLYEAELKVYELKMNKLRAYILEKLINEHGDRKKYANNDEFLDKVIVKGDAKVTAKEIDVFVKERKIPAENMDAELKGRIEQFITMEKKKVMVEKWIDSQLAKNPVEVYIQKPSRPIADVKSDGPFIGSASAKVTIVEFSDFQCPFCSKGAAVVHDLKKKYGDKVKIVFKNFPLPFHQNARGAANASFCANEQSVEAFWKLHDWMFENQEKLDIPSLKEAGKKIGVKADVFAQCLDSMKYSAKIDSDMKEGQDVGVKSTPTFFVNGQLVSGAQPIEVFAEIIDAELKK
jgi:protein-disulfide isomerase